MTTVCRRAIAGAVILCAGLAFSGGAADASPVWVTDPECNVAAASPLLPPDHWAVAAAARAEALGLLSLYLPAQRAVPRATVCEALREAARRASTDEPAWRDVTAGWLARFSAEFPVGRAATQESALRWLGGSGGLDYVGHAGVLEPGFGLFEGRKDPIHVADASELALRGAAAVSLAGRFTAVAEPAAATDGVHIPRWEAVAALGLVTLAAGDQPVGYGYGRSGGIVLSGQPLRRAELQTPRPVLLPGPLRLFGPASFHTFVSRFGEERHPGDPYFWGMRAALQPHPRLTIAVNRAAMFGGDSINTPVTARNLAGMLVGVLSRDFENQIVSADFRFRAPTEAVLPMTLYLEWGSEDAAGAWWAVPAQVMGVYLPVIPGVPSLAAGVEWTRFDIHCCGNPPWYLHGAFPGGWASRGAPLGHPLAGEGWEALLYASAELADGRGRVEGRTFRRSRGMDGYVNTIQRAGNLFAPTRSGISWGADVRGAWRPTPRTELTASIFRDAGEGWSENRVSAAAAVFF